MNGVAQGAMPRAGPVRVAGDATEGQPAGGVVA
jgi:hypothetical protein